MKTLFTLSAVLITLSLIAVPPGNSRELLDKVVASVNDDVITLRQFEETREQFIRRAGEGISDREILEEMIDRTLIQQQARKVGVRVTDAELDGTIDMLKQRYNLEGDELALALGEHNMTEEEFREQWRHQLLTKKVLDNQLQGRIAVTEEDIIEYYTENFGEIEPVNEVRIAHIVINRQSPDAFDEAENIARLAKGKEDFEELARRYSQDTASAARGGDLGFFREGELIEEIDNAIRGMKRGEVAGPIETPLGYHIVKVLDRKSMEEGIPESTKAEIRETLHNQKVEKYLEEWLTDVKGNSYIDRKI